MAKAAAACCDVVRYNFTGVLKISDAVKELQAVIAEVRRQRRDCAVSLLGRSLGGVVSLLAAAEDKAVERLILWATPGDLHKTLVHVVGALNYERLKNGTSIWLHDERGSCRIDPDFSEDFDRIDLAAGIRLWDGRPVLILHCEGDDVVPVEHARTNTLLFKGSAKLHVYEGGDHHFTEHNEAAAALIAQWLGSDI